MKNRQEKRENRHRSTLLNMISFIDLTIIKVKTYVQHKKIVSIISFLEEFTLVTKNRQEERENRHVSNLSNIYMYVQHKKIASIISFLEEFTLVTKNRQEEPPYINDTNRPF